jgi:hypothetical protein
LNWSLKFAIYLSAAGSNHAFQPNPIRWIRAGFSKLESLQQRRRFGLKIPVKRLRKEANRQNAFDQSWTKIEKRFFDADAAMRLATVLRCVHRAIPKELDQDRQKLLRKIWKYAEDYLLSKPKLANQFRFLTPGVFVSDSAI